MSGDMQSLRVLLDHVERQRDQALAEHRRKRQAAEAAAAQSEQLLAYRRDYQQRWSSRFQQQQGDIELVRCYHQFMEKLGQAVDHQGRVAAHAAQQTCHTEAELRACELRCASVQKLIERRTLEARARAERRDQKQTDEQATRAAWAQRDADAPL